MDTITAKRKFNIGDTVFYFDSWGVLREGVVTGIIEQPGKEVYVSTRLSDRGSAGAKMSDCHATKKECLRAENERIKKQIADYKAEIKDVNDLVAFCLTHNVSGDPEYGDSEARQAAVIRAGELLGIKIEY